MSATALRPRRVGEILDAGIKVYIRNARTLMGLVAVVVIPLQFLVAIVLLSTLPAGSDVPNGTFSFSAQRAVPADPAAALGADVLLLIVQLLASWLTTAACVKAVSDAYLDEPTSFKDSLRFAVRRLPALAGMEILLALGLVAGGIALVIPAIWLYVSWLVAAPALLIERVGAARALGRSRKLVRGRWWPTAAVLIVASIMVSVVSGALQALLAAVASLPSQPSLVLAVALVTVSGAISTIVAQPFHAAVSTILYYDLRVRHEGFDLHVLAEQLGLPAVAGSGDSPAAQSLPVGPESVGRPDGPPFWPPPPGWRPG
jgi:hypothetical protein